MTQLGLFDVVVDVQVDDELRAGDDAAASCRFCQTWSTAAGIVRFEHGPDSITCERYRSWASA